MTTGLFSNSQDNTPREHSADVPARTAAINLATTVGITDVASMLINGLSDREVALNLAEVLCGPASEHSFDELFDAAMTAVPRVAELREQLRAEFDRENIVASF